MLQAEHSITSILDCSCGEAILPSSREQNVSVSIALAWAARPAPALTGKATLPKSLSNSAAEPPAPPAEPPPGPPVNLTRRAVKRTSPIAAIVPAIFEPIPQLAHFIPLAVHLTAPAVHLTPPLVQTAAGVVQMVPPEVIPAPPTVTAVPLGVQMIPPDVITVPLAVITVPPAVITLPPAVITFPPAVITLPRAVIAAPQAVNRLWTGAATTPRRHAKGFFINSYIPDPVRPSRPKALDGNLASLRETHLYNSASFPGKAGVQAFSCGFCPLRAAAPPTISMSA